MMMNNMKVKKGLFRIYIVLSIMWSAFFLLAMVESAFVTRGVGLDDLYLIIMATLPVPLYFVLKWISDGFK